MPQASQRIANASLALCVAVCGLIGILLFVNSSSREAIEYHGSGEGWLYFLFPAHHYVVLGILGLAFRKNVFLSWWVLAAVIATTLLNPGLHALLFGGGNNTGVAMAIGFGPIVIWLTLGAMVVGGLVVWVILRRRTQARPESTLSERP